ncbi:helix-turn-helix transcriptional regulator [Synechococcus sp. H60.3]|uniref:XRE family transcriptional regulator n=1 Tax=unclassified Synechococcus TaxID=2626047 RepID=UPI0039C072DD
MSTSSDSSFAARLRQVIGNEAIYAFGRRAGISDTALRSYLKGSVPGIDKAVKIAQVGGVSLSWLITGEGSPGDAKTEYVYVPLVDVVASAGAGALVREESIESVLAFERNWLRAHLKGNPDGLSLIRVQGNSMSPTLEDGDWIFVERQEELGEEGIYVFQRDGELWVKRLHRLSGSRVKVISDNPRFPSFVVDCADPVNGLTLIGRYRGRLSFD